MSTPRAIGVLRELRAQMNTARETITHAAVQELIARMDGIFDAFDETLQKSACALCAQTDFWRGAPKPNTGAAAPVFGFMASVEAVEAALIEPLSNVVEQLRAIERTVSQVDDLRADVKTLTARVASLETTVEEQKDTISELRADMKLHRENEKRLRLRSALACITSFVVDMFVPYDADERPDTLNKLRAWLGPARVGELEAMLEKHGITRETEIQVQRARGYLSGFAHPDVLKYTPDQLHALVFESLDINKTFTLSQEKLHQYIDLFVALRAA